MQYFYIFILYYSIEFLTYYLVPQDGAATQCLNANSILAVASSELEAFSIADLVAQHVTFGKTF